MRVELGPRLEPIRLEDGHAGLLLVVTLAGSAIGTVKIRASGVVGPEVQWAAIEERLGRPLRREALRRAFRTAIRGGHGDAPTDPPAVSVVVSAYEQPRRLRDCLESLARLRATPQEVLVTGLQPGDDEARADCAAYGARFLAGVDERSPDPGLESRGELIAFTDSGCAVDPTWLDDLGQAFSDPLVAAVTGYVGPLELESAAQHAIERHAAIRPYGERTVLDGAFSTSPLVQAASVGSGANAIIRRSMLAETGVVADARGAGRPGGSAAERYAFYRLLAAGYRIAYEPTRIVWHRHEPVDPGRVLRAHSGSAARYAALCLIRHREPAGARLWLGAWRTHLRHVVGTGEGRGGSARSLIREAIGGPARNVDPARSRSDARGRRPAPGSPRACGDVPRSAVVDPSHPRLSVVVSSFNRRALLERALRALSAQTYPADRFEVVVVLDGSTDGSAEMVRSLELPFEPRLLEQENKGVAAAKDRGLREAAEELVVFMDDDMIPEPQFLAAHAGAHRTGDEKHVVIGYCPGLIEEPGQWALVARAHWEDHFRNKAEPDHQWSPLDFSVGNSSLHRPLILRCGGFDLDLRRNEEQELGIRLVAGGARFDYRKDARAWHRFEGRLEDHLRIQREQGFNDVLLVQRHPQLLSRIVVAGFAREESRDLSARASFGYRYAETLSRLTPLGLRLARGCELLRLRRPFHRLAGSLMASAHIAGVKEALPARSELLLFLEPLWRERPQETLTIQIEQARRLGIPPGDGRIELEVRYAGTVLATLPARQPAQEWSWEGATERAVSVLLEPSERAIPLRDLVALAAGGGSSADHDGHA